MANLLLGGVTQGLVGAAGAMKVVDVAMHVYAQKKAMGDHEGMRRAFGYASDNMKIANENMEDAKVALSENVEEAHEQAKTEQAERLEKAQQEAKEKTDESQAKIDEINEKIKNPVDTVEISDEAIAALQKDQTEVVQNGDTTDTSEQSSNLQKTKKHKHVDMNVGDSRSYVGGSVSVKKHSKLNIKV